MDVVLFVSAMDCICHNYVGGGIFPLYVICKAFNLPYTGGYFGLFCEGKCFFPLYARDCEDYSIFFFNAKGYFVLFMKVKYFIFFMLDGILVSFDR